MQKIRRPKVNLPGSYKILAMMSDIRLNKGKTDRTFINMMCSAIHSYEKKKQENFHKVTKDLSDEQT